MAVVSLTGDDTIKLNDRVLSDFADGEIAGLTFPNALMEVKTGKNGNSLFAFNQSGKQCEVSLRVMRGSADDKFLQNLLTLMMNSPTTFILLQGSFIKSIGTGSGSVVSDTYVLSGGVFTKQIEVNSHTDGSTDQAVSVYHIKFTNSPRVIG